MAYCTKYLILGILKNTDVPLCRLDIVKMMPASKDLSIKSFKKNHLKDYEKIKMSFRRLCNEGHVKVRSYHKVRSQKVQFLEITKKGIEAYDEILWKDQNFHKMRQMSAIGTTLPAEDSKLSLLEMMENINSKISKFSIEEQIRIYHISWSGQGDFGYLKNILGEENTKIFNNITAQIPKIEGIANILSKIENCKIMVSEYNCFQNFSKIWNCYQTKDILIKLLLGASSIKEYCKANRELFHFINDFRLHEAKKMLNAEYKILKIFEEK